MERTLGLLASRDDARQVSEESVLEDPVGLHLGAGPYLLLYSQALPDGAEPVDLQWPPPIKACPAFYAHAERTLIFCRTDGCREPQPRAVGAAAMLAGGEQRSAGQGGCFGLSSGRPHGCCILRVQSERCML